MPDNIRFSNPDTMQKPPGYSHVVEVTGPGRTVYFAGRLAIDKSGKMGANAREQMEMALENVKAALASVGASFDNVVKLNNYIVDIGTNIAHYREVRDKYVNTAAPPASTTIGVPQLARAQAPCSRSRRSRYCRRSNYASSGCAAPIATHSVTSSAQQELFGNC
jgi:enamine deaminase RidA (YjgF/YER057c/UK114 family)